MKKICELLLIVVFIALIVGTDIIAYKTPDVEYSESEQRELAMKPNYAVFSDPSLWLADVDQYLIDQFPYRTVFIGQYHAAQAQAGNTIVQELYQLDTEYMFMFTYPTTDKKTTRLAQLLKSTSEKYSIPVVYGIVPIKNTALADSIEDLSNETNLLNRDRTVAAMTDAGIPCIDVCGYFLENLSQDELKDCYFKSDFHWNPKGGYNAAAAIAKGMQDLKLIDELPKTSDFQWVDFTEDRSYMGDLQRRVSEEPFPGEYIPFYELRNTDGLHYYTETDGEEKDRDTIVARGLEEEILSYNIVSTDNLAYLRIVNDNAVNKKKVLIFKDSYECVMTDYLTDMFSEIIVMDPRMVKYSLDEVLNSSDIDCILCVYHESNISAELIQFLE